MEPIGDLRLLREKGNSNSTTSKWKFQYVPDPNASMYWPNGKDLKEIVDEPECGFDGSNCNQDESGSKGIVTRCFFLVQNSIYLIKGTLFVPI